MRALVTALIYFGTFLSIGLVAKLAVDRWMSRKGADLDDVHAQAGPNRRPRRVFLLGAWRTER
jgi:hypothetical protein